MSNITKIFLYSLLVKLGLSLALPILPDEAYYWVWGFHLDWSFYDHPALVGVLGWLGEGVRSQLAFVGQGAIRWPALVVGHLSLWVWLMFFRETLGTRNERTETLWLIVMLAHPLFGIGSFILNPDIPLLLFWPLSFLLFSRALRTQSLGDYALLGISLGLGFLSKYHIVLAAPIILLSALMPSQRARVQWRFVPFTVAMGLVASSPVFIWNAQNDWLSFQFQLRHGLGKPYWDPWWTWSYVLGQALLLGPLLVPSLWQGWKQVKHPQIFLQMAVPWIFFFLTSFKSAVEANWPIIALPAALWVALQGLHSLKMYWGNILMWTSALAITLLQIFTPAGAWTNMKVKEVQDLKTVAKAARSYEPLFAGSYQIASSLWLHLQRPVYKLKGMNRFDVFDTLSESAPKSYPYYLVRSNDQGLPEFLGKDPSVTVTLEKELENYQILRVELKP